VDRLPRLPAVFNVTGGEVLIILVIALVVLGPEKLPDVVRKVGRVYGEMRRMANGFQSELRSTLEEPTRELRDTLEQARHGFESPTPSGPAVADTDAHAPATADPADPFPHAWRDASTADGATDPSAPPLRTSASASLPPPTGVPLVPGGGAWIPSPPMPGSSADGTQPEHAADRIHDA
jgi:sec-independent protein translocase protein TatB